MNQSTPLVTACIDECEEVSKATIPLATPETLLSPSQSTNDDSFESSSNVWSDIASSCASSNGNNEVSTASPPPTRAPYLGSICHSHMVLFYYDEEYLYNSITSFAAPCLASGGGAIIIATRDHILRIEAKLRERQIDVEKKKQKGVLVFLDAHETLSALQTTDGRISEKIFHTLIEKAVKSLVKNTNGTLFAFGELVDILGQRREYHSALELESIWDDFLERQPFQLLCGYDMNCFSDATDVDILRNICRLHTHVDDANATSGTDEEVQNQRLTIALLKYKSSALKQELNRRKVAEAALHASLRIISENAQSVVTRERDRYRNVLSTLPVGVYGITFGDDEDFYVNSRFCELVGRSDSEIRKRGWIDIIHPDDRKEVEKDWPFCYDNDCRTYATLAKQHEYRLNPPNHPTVWVKAETAPTYADNSHLLGYIHTIMDITELKLTEKQRLEAQHAAEEQQRHRAEEAEKHKLLQDQWIDSLCHELRNPLNGISGNVELMRSSVDVRKGILGKPTVEDTDIQTLREQLPLDEESIGAIENCVAQQKIITDDVLNLSKLELGKVELNKIDFYLNNVLSGIIGMFQAEASSKGLNLCADFDDTCSKVHNDPQRLSQVVINLLANAIKFTETGTVTVISRVETNPTYNIVRISIQDTGVGMSETEKANLFQRFAQPTSKNTFHEYGGSGLGLYISKNLVELMEGSIQVESQKGKGSTFSFTFNDEQAPKGVLRSPSPMFSSTGSSSSPISSNSNDGYFTIDHPGSPPLEACTKRKIRKILIVEDNKVNQRMMLRLLHVKGYEVLIAEHGREALSRLESYSVDLVIMDIQMPVMDGITATKKIRKKEQQEGREPIPIIGLSGNAREFHATNALQNGLNFYMTKPVKSAELHAAIELFEKQTLQND